MFRGREVHLPGGLFSRNTAGPAPAVARHPSASNWPAGGQTRQGSLPSAASVSRSAGPPSQRLPANSAPSNSSQPIARAIPAEPRVAAGPRSATSNRKSPTAATSPASAAAGPQSPAEQLVAQAHAWSAKAQSEEEFSRIIETCRRARASQPSEVAAKYANDLAGWALNRRGQLKAETGRTQEAILDFDDAIRADAQCWRAVHNRGVLLAQAGNFEKAFDDFNRTIQINPDFGKAYSNRGALFVVAGNLNGALEDYGRAIECDPNLAVAHRGRGRVCHLLGRLEEAIAHYDAAVQLAPSDAYAVASRADLLTDLGRYVDANAEYEQAMELDPNSVHAYSGSAWLLATCPDSAVRNPKLAIERAQASMELSGKKDAVSFDTLAAAQASAGDFTAASQTVRQAMELASPAERDIYQDRLSMYQHSKPYLIAPVRPVSQASYQAGSMEPGAGSKNF